MSTSGAASTSPSTTSCSLPLTAPAATTGDADASAVGMMDVDSAEEASPSLLRQGDLRVLLSLLHSAGSELHPALLALLHRSMRAAPPG